jgi:hypothetical protein
LRPYSNPVKHRAPLLDPADPDRLAEAILTDEQGDPGIQVFSILSVQGVSVRARATWFEDNKYAQVATESYRPTGK